jgi:serine carboxypeptidase-like clade 1
LYVSAGESYGGVYVPLLARALLRHNQRVRQQQQLQAAGKTPGSPSHSSSSSSTARRSDRVYNVAGYVVGNAVTDDMYDFGGQVDFAFSLGLIDPDTYRLVKQTCKVRTLDLVKLVGDTMEFFVAFLLPHTQTGF